MDSDVAVAGVNAVNAVDAIDRPDGVDGAKLSKNALKRKLKAEKRNG